MNILQGAESRVNIALYFSNIDMFGLSKAKVYKAAGFNRPSELDVVDIRFKTPSLMIVGPYKASGRILLLPLSGQGKSSMILGTQGDINFWHFFNLHLLHLLNQTMCTF
jgi:hypothetical protein